MNCIIKDMDKKFAITRKGLKLLIIGFLVMVAGYILMIGGGSKDPQVFSEAMFDFRRLVAAPLVIMCGVIIEVIAIMRKPKKGEDESQSESETNDK